jgi:hypothetical protein
MTRLSSLAERLWTASRPLTAFGIAMAALTVVLGAMALVDPTEIDHHVRWIKPMKFTISFAVYAASVAWILGWVAPGRKPIAVSSILAVTGVVEIAVITLQAFRGRTSHFNTETLLDAALFDVMGAGIVLFFVANMAAVVMAFRARIADRVLATGLKLGFAVASAGMLEAALMLPPTDEQAAELAAGTVPRRLGSHAVGAEDGGAGLPFFGWSTEHGDLRPAHFFGMHALQLLPLLALAARRRKRWSEEQKVRMVWTWSAAYLALTALLTWQALRGQPIVAPDALTVGALATIAFFTLLVSFLIDQQPLIDRYAEAAR